jgi:membrane protease YdiL (CAAX protease family)
LPLDSSGTDFESSANLVFVLFLNISFIMAGWITLKWIDHRPPALLGMNFWPSSAREFFIGIGIGVASFGMVLITLVLIGDVSIRWSGIAAKDFDVFGFYFAVYLLFAMIEEVINRGYLFQTLCEGIGKVGTAVIISLIFSMVHIFNPDFSVLAGIFLFIHGLMYAVVYIKTCSLWTPIGLHMAWNFTQGPVAGMRVSGTSVESSFFSTELRGPDMLTGGSFGIEGGLVAIIISAIILLVILRANWLKPSERFLKAERAWADGLQAQE